MPKMNFYFKFIPNIEPSSLLLKEIDAGENAESI